MTEGPPELSDFGLTELWFFRQVVQSQPEWEMGRCRDGWQQVLGDAPVPIQQPFESALETDQPLSPGRKVIKGESPRDVGPSTSKTLPGLEVVPTTPLGAEPPPSSAPDALVCAGLSALWVHARGHGHCVRHIPLELFYRQASRRLHVATIPHRPRPCNQNVYRGQGRPSGPRIVRLARAKGMAEESPPRDAGALLALVSSLRIALVWRCPGTRETK